MRSVSASLLTLAAATVAAVLVLQLLRTGGLPDPTGHGDFGARVLDIAVLVFREGLECILVLAAITANMVGHAARVPAARRGRRRRGALRHARHLVRRRRHHRQPRRSVPALDIQAATGLLAIIVLLVVMNWFFHKVYWTGWISMHSRREADADAARLRRRSVWWGLGLLGFSSLYREGFEVVLFLQSYRLQLGTAVLSGVATASR